MGVAKVGGPVPSARHGMEEIDSKLRSILLIIVIYRFMCDKFSFLGFFGVGVGVNVKCLSLSVNIITLSLDVSLT